MMAINGHLLSNEYFPRSLANHKVMSKAGNQLKSNGHFPNIVIKLYVIDIKRESRKSWLDMWLMRIKATSFIVLNGFFWQYYIKTSARQAAEYSEAFKEFICKAKFSDTLIVFICFLWVYYKSVLFESVYWLNNSTKRSWCVKLNLRTYSRCTLVSVF